MEVNECVTSCMFIWNVENSTSWMIFFVLTRCVSYFLRLCFIYHLIPHNHFRSVTRSADKWSPEHWFGWLNFPFFEKYNNFLSIEIFTFQIEFIFFQSWVRNSKIKKNQSNFLHNANFRSSFPRSILNNKLIFIVLRWFLHVLYSCTDTCAGCDDLYRFRVRFSLILNITLSNHPLII